MIRYSALAVATALSFALSATQAAGTSDDTTRFDECKQKLVEAQKLDLLFDLAWNPPKPPHVVVGHTYFRLRSDAREGFAQTVNCFLMAGRGDRYINFPIKDQRNNVVGKWENGRLRE